MPVFISVIIPCRNEERYIRGCLDSLIDDFVVKNAEILVIDGMSSDSTRELVKKYVKEHKDVDMELLDNPKKHQSHGLNIGIDEAKGEIIVRVDAHAKYPKDYVKRCVDLLESTGADNVGGAVDAKGKTKFQRLVAIAQHHPVGVGNARFRLGNYKGYVSTVFPGTFRRSIFKKLGYFDPYMNEDGEFNLRILKAGGKIYLDSSIKVEYFPRSSLKELAKQYFNYGKGRCRTTLKHGRFTSLRQLAPIFLVLGLVGSFVLAALNPIFLLFPLLYLALILLVSFTILRRDDGQLRGVFLLSVIFVVMHVSWGCGFLAKLLGR